MLSNRISSSSPRARFAFASVSSTRATRRRRRAPVARPPSRRARALASMPRERMRARRRRPLARASSRVVACVALALACWSSRCESTSAKDADAAARALRDELSTLREALREAREASTALGKAVHGAERALKRMGGLVKTPGVAATDGDAMRRRRPRRRTTRRASTVIRSAWRRARCPRRAS